MPDTIGVETPYPGLRPFEPHESEVFFGREAHTDRLLEILQRERFLAVIGPSGSGKSSLVRAGLLPGLRMGALGSGSDWRIAVLRPGDQPIRSLATALLQPAVFALELAGPEAGNSIGVEHLAMVAAELRRGPLGLLQVTEQARRQSVNLLVVVDQFEEIFTYAEAGDEHGDESEAFVNLLLTSRAEPDARIYVVLTMRTDFLGNCVRFTDLPDAINRAQYLTPRLARPEMETAIVGPAEVFGGRIAPSLVAEIINATGRNPDQLPLLQHALSRMWTLASTRDPVTPVIGWDDVQAVGGLSGALDQHAENVLRELMACMNDSDPLIEALFCAITERRTASSGGQDVRRPQTLARIAAACSVPWSTLVPIVEAYAAPDVSLLQYGRTLDEGSVIDLSHEALMRQWKRLSGWVDTEARRAADYGRWTERESDHRNKQGGLLEGAVLARATEWLGGRKEGGRYVWRPTAAWAARYATTADGHNAFEEFARTVAFIEQSAEHLRQQEQEEIDRRERDRAATLERAAAAERAAKQAQRRAVQTGIVALVLLALAVTSVYFYQRAARAVSGERAAAVAAVAAQTRAEQSEAEAKTQRDRADKLALQANAQLNIALGPSATSYGGVSTTTAGGNTPTGGNSGARPLSMADLAAIMPGSTEPLRSAYLAPQQGDGGVRDQHAAPAGPFSGADVA